MTTYYVATLAPYVLVDATDEVTAREFGQAALYELYSDLRERWGKDVPIEIRTIREATTDEIDMHRWQQQTLAAETNRWKSRIAETVSGSWPWKPIPTRSRSARPERS